MSVETLFALVARKRNVERASAKELTQIPEKAMGSNDIHPSKFPDGLKECSYSR
jgi:hypothetical protein